MKLGYSILLGEHINAEGVGYDDCKNFQIVCPSCNEPIFKVHRIDPDDIHYLSHYRRDKALDEECELRVATLNRKEIEHKNVISRGQKIEFFLSVLKDALLENVRGHFRPEEYRKYLGSIMSSTGPQMLRDNIYKGFDVSKNDIAENFEKIVNITKDRKTFRPTAFSIEVQQRICTDICMLLRTPKGFSNFTFLFAVAYAYTLDIYRSVRDHGTFEQPWQAKILEALEGMIKSSREKAVRYMTDLYNTPRVEMNCLEYLVGIIFAEMLQQLIRVPYFDLLKKARETGKL